MKKPHVRVQGEGKNALYFCNGRAISATLIMQVRDILLDGIADHFCAFKRLPGENADVFRERIFSDLNARAKQTTEEA